MTSYFSPPDSTAPRVWLTAAAQHQSEQLHGMAQSELECFAGGSLSKASMWRDGPLDQLRTIPVTGSAIPALRRAYREAKQAGHVPPMARELAAAVVSALMAEMPSSDGSAWLRPVFDHLLIPTYLAVVFDPTLALAERIADVERYFPEVISAAMSIAAPNTSAVLAIGTEDHPAQSSVRDLMVGPGSLLHWLGAALCSAGGEFSWRHPDAIIYLAGTKYLELLRAEAVVEELNRRGIPLP